MNLFRIDNTDHDTLGFEGSDFGTDPAGQLAGVLANGHFEKRGVVITDPTIRSHPFRGDGSIPSVIILSVIPGRA